jgi:hypothetical protein
MASKGLIMSVYSGFVTRQQESAYFSLTEQLVCTLQNKLLELLQGTPLTAPQVAAEFLPVFGQLARMETNKYLPPKISHCCRQLAEFLGESYQGNRSYASAEAYPETNWANTTAYPRVSRGASKSSISYSDTSRRRKPKISSSRLTQGRSNRGILYETSIIEERPVPRLPQRNYYAQMFTKKLGSYSPVDRHKNSSKRTFSQIPSPFKSGRHLMMPITTLF